MDDLTVLLLGVTAIGAGVLIANARQRQVGGVTPTARMPETPSITERKVHLGTYPAGQVPSSRQLAEQQISAGQFQSGDLRALTEAIEARRYSIAQTPGTHKLYPYRADGMIDVGYQTRGNVRGPLSYVSYPVGGTPAQGTWSPI